MKKQLTAVLASALALTMLSGCGGNKTSENNNGEFTKTTNGEYPIQTEEKLTYWCDMSGHVSTHAKSLNDTVFAKSLIERTGINVEFIHPVAGGSGSNSEQFNLMIASGDLPDIIESDWGSYPGGPEQALSENIIIKLNDILDEISPNLNNFYNENPEIRKQMQTVSGNFFHYPFVRGDNKLMTYIGPMIRKDLLDKVSMEEPETIEEWDAVLRAFKAAGVKTPLTLKIDNGGLGNSAFLGAYGLAGTFYVEDDKVKFGPYEPKFKDYIAQMTEWYADGIFDANFMDTDAKRITALVANGDVGAAFGSAGGDFGKWIPALKEVVPTAEFIPVKYPSAEKGGTAFYGQKDLPAGTFGASISGKTKNVELAARFLDYGFSEAGHMLYNFGNEGESYVMKDGIPSYTEIITDIEKNGGLAIGGAIGKYARASYNGPFVQNVHYLDQFYSLDPQKKAIGLWPNTAALDHKMPSNLLTAEENEEYTKIIQDIDTYRQTELYKFITGKSTDHDNYFKELKDRGIERAIEIQQGAYDRYKLRK